MNSVVCPTALEDYNVLIGIDKEMAVIWHSWYTFLRSADWLGTEAVMWVAQAFKFFVVTPFYLLFIFGNYLGHGGNDIYDICAGKTGHPSSFWKHDPESRQQCTNSVTKEFAAFLTTILVPVYFVLLGMVLLKLARVIHKNLCEITRLTARITKRCLPREVRGAWNRMWTDTPPPPFSAR